MAAEPQLDNADLFRELDSYPWASDSVFQSALKAMMGPNPSPTQTSEFTIRARCLYFSRKRGINISPDAYKAYLASHPSSSSSSSFLPGTSPAAPFSTPGPPLPPPLSQAAPTPTPTNTTDPTAAGPAGSATAAAPAPTCLSASPLSSSSQPPAIPQAPYPQSFNDIVELITSGRPVPGIREIPDTVLRGQGSQPRLPQRRKPWEKEVPRVTGGTFGDRRDVYVRQELPDDDGENESGGGDRGGGGGAGRSEEMGD